MLCLMMGCQTMTLSQKAPVKRLLFDCESTVLSVVFYGDDYAELRYQSRVIKLHRAISASGARYVGQTEHTEFWNKGHAARVKINGNLLGECVARNG